MVDSPDGRVPEPREDARAGTPPRTFDHVDEIVAAWLREDPGLDVEPLHVLSRVSRLSRHLEIARRGAFSTHSLEVGEFDVLAALRRVGPPYELSPGALVEATLSTSGTMTNRVDQLERRGYVERRPDPFDRRGVRVRATATGLTAVADALAELLEREKAFLTPLDAAERETLAGLLRRLLLAIEDDR